MHPCLERSLLNVVIPRCRPPSLPPPRAPVLPFDGSAHTSAAEFHLAQLSRLLLPTLTTRVCMHAVLQTAGGGRRGGEGEGEAPRGEGGNNGGARRQHELAPTGGTPTPQSSANRLVPAGAHSSSSSSTAEFGTGGGGTAAEGEGQGAGGQKLAVGLGGTGVADGGAVDMWTSLVDVLEVT